MENRREVDRPRERETERERKREREALVISCVEALGNVTMSPFCGDTGADGQFTPLPALAVFPHKHSAGELSDSHHIAPGSHVRYQTKTRCRLFAIITRYADFCLAGG